MSKWLLFVLVCACGGTETPPPPPDAGVVVANIDGCWNYTLGSAAGAMHIDGSVGDFAWNAQPPSGSIFRANEPDGLFILQFYCATINCGISLADGGTEPKDTAPDAGDPDTRSLFSVQGKSAASVTSDAGTFTMTACP